MQYRLDKKELMETISAWNNFLGKKVHLIACGGTALTLLGVKSSTKDADMIVPDETEYEYLIKVLKDLGYRPATLMGWQRDEGFIFDLFKGNRVYTTELLESPLKKENHIAIKEFSRIYMGVLNYYDIIISKLFRGTGVDVEDCLSLVKSKKEQIDINLLKARFLETSSYDVSEDKVVKNLEYFLKILKKENIYEG
ncbi:MAG: DUF6036 family nucleotidyltransferase [Candidatus Omnitrophota bacterium]